MGSEGDRETRMQSDRADSSPVVGYDAEHYWSCSADDLLKKMGTSPAGLSSTEAGARLTRMGPNVVGLRQKAPALVSFARQFGNPLVIILIFAAGVSAVVGDGKEATIIMVIVLASCILSFTQEYGASKAMERLRQQISQKATVLRDGTETTVRAGDIVPGDIICLSAGNLIPADGIIIKARDFNVSEAALTGETFPVVKTPGVSPTNAPVSSRTNAVFTGTSVRSGTAIVLAVKTGNQTEYAGIAAALQRNLPETEFTRGIRHFGALMTKVMLTIVIIVLTVNLFMHRPLVDSLLFSLALAVGLTPELLPAIISVTLARGARAMATSGVIVRRLEAIENLGSMDILCTDKTGTLTEGLIHLDGYLGVDGQPSNDVLRWAKLNAVLQTGLKNPLDEAIASAPDLSPPLGYTKVDEIPYDFLRKRLSVVVRDPSEVSADLLICKGAVSNVLAVCSSIVTATGTQSLDDSNRLAINQRFQAWSEDGFRVLGLAIRRLEHQAAYSREDEADLSFAGFLLFLDPPKSDVKETLGALAGRGVAIKVITGDNQYVAKHLAATIGLGTEHMLTGEDLTGMTKNALFAAAPKVDLFVEIDPNQKERIIEALRRADHVVGYMGDGINDAPAMHAADIGISVDSAVDVAREAADIVLLKRDLRVLLAGIDDGRRTFANTMKYIAITTSANFGNMLSMACGSLFLPFLPLLAKQILLNNLLSSVPSLAIAGDNVDAALVATPRRWDIGSVRTFMISFGLVSSVFDFLTFGFLLLVLHSTVDMFRTAWFVESLLTQLSIMLIVRTYMPFWKSRPSALLAGLTIVVAAFAIAIPYLPFAQWFGFVALPLPVMAGIIAITLFYIVASEATKRWFFRHQRFAVQAPANN